MVRFVDEVKVEVRAGHGGAGSASFRREKFIPKGGPDGGDGGRGGHVILEASRDRNTLQELYLRKRIMAENGKPGAGRNRHGRDGEDIVLKVPVGTIVKDEDGQVLADLATDGRQWIMAKGGRGGLGNSHFATSVNRAPRYAQPGEDGESGIRYLELKSMADVGLVGLPNAGKSTLLAHISNARPKIADYPFTTLAPMLGQVFMDEGDGFVVADIPGLIEGAHEGRGLGHRFLRHIERTQVLLHLVDAASPDGRSLSAQVREVEAELKGYGGTIGQKPRLLVINKIDALSAEELARIRTEAEALDLPVYAISAVSGEGISRLLHGVYAMVREQRRLHAPLSVDIEEDAA
jgi:GTPase